MSSPNPQPPAQVPPPAPSGESPAPRPSNDPQPPSVNLSASTHSAYCHPSDLSASSDSTPHENLQHARPLVTTMGEAKHGINGEYYPHIMDAIVDAADYDARLLLRTLDRQIRKRVDGILAEHLVWLGGVMYTKGPEGTLRRYPLTVLNADLKRYLCFAKNAPSLRGIRTFTKTMDIRSPVLMKDIFDMSSGLSVLRLKITSFGEEKVGLIRADNVDTVVVSDDVSTSSLPTLPRGPQIPLLPARFLSLGQLPRRVVLHMNDQSFQVMSYFFFERIKDKAELHNSELILVAGSLRDTALHSLYFFLKVYVMSPSPATRGFNRYVLVNPMTEIQSVISIHIPNFDSSTPTLGSLMSAMSEEHAGFKAKFRQVSLDDWAKELGEERFKVEMGL